MQGLTQTLGLSSSDPVSAGIIRKLTAAGLTIADSSMTLPANAYIQRIIVKNNTANAVTGGLKFGTTNGGVDIMAALAVGASVLVTDIGTGLLKSLFSLTATQQIFIDAVAAWNSANVDVTIIYVQLT